MNKYAIHIVCPHSLSPPELISQSFICSNNNKKHAHQYKLVEQDSKAYNFISVLQVDNL